MITSDKLSIGSPSSPKKSKEDFGISMDILRQDYEGAISQFERVYFTKILEQNDWNTRSAAIEAGISREWLSKKIKRLNIQRM